MTAYQPALDGTAPPAPPRGEQEAAERLAIDHLRSLDLIEPQHEPLVAQLLVLAARIDREGRLSVAWQKAQELLADLRDKLPMPVAAVDDKWDAIQRDLERLERGIGVDA
ncbi:hypothetical protein [Cellulosimicrobium sp. I38E]|uniref:hypothetical protein n=1 Tax=Cellulosimicrobium sp. I38E TaxID=1393139 RepID=UPI0007B2F8DD|nr:hypothetical protein [Cellulosimicrobium sp. I38E]KZM77955.1 hypothetical protein A0J59_14935 [Cellulosimicrobium sp. I38E]